ncbi:MAG: putative DNA binding domain-containing protein [Chloroflexia bacterium]|nr:putative DNA binding domain-containing protein [Chloroflexia bacterium]
MDLHIHTPASIDYQQPAVTPLDILRRAAEQALDVISFTDHNSVRGYADMWREIEDLELLEYLKRLQPEEVERLGEYRRLLDQILVLPGFEFTATFGFHVLAIFPEGTSVRLMEHLLLQLGVPEEKFGSGEVGATSDVLRVYETLAEHGALVIGAHVNSTHGVAMQGLRFGAQTKIAYTQDPHLHALEVTDLALGPHRRSTARFFNGTKPEYPRQMHCIQGSDAHRLTPDPERESQLGIGDRATEVLLPEISFDAIKALFLGNHFDRTRPLVPAPADPVKAARLEGNSDAQSFHENLSTKRTGISHVLRDVVAFANSGGGTVFVGASAAEKRPVHGVEEADTAAESLRGEIATQVMPAVEATVDIVESDGKAVLVVAVADGRAKPHALLPSAILVRRGAESDAANRDEIVAMVTAAAGPVSVVPAAGSSAPAPRRPATNGRGRAVVPPTAGSKPVVARGSHPAEPGRRNGRDEGSAASLGAEPIAAPAAPSVPDLDVYEEAVAADPIAPTSGVEVVHAYEQDGVVYYTLRDLRDHKLIHNLTRDTDRRLFRSAIAQHEEQAVDEEKIRWLGDFGLWRTYRPRGGERRYHLVYGGDGDLRVFYGVSEAGMAGPWRELLGTGS